MNECTTISKLFLLVQLLNLFYGITEKNIYCISLLVIKEVSLSHANISKMYKHLIVEKKAVCIKCLPVIQLCLLWC